MVYQNDTGWIVITPPHAVAPTLQLSALASPHAPIILRVVSARGRVQATFELTRADLREALIRAGLAHTTPSA